MMAPGSSIPPDCVPAAPSEVVFEILKGPVRPGIYEFTVYWQVQYVVGLPDGDGPFTRAQVFLASPVLHKDHWLAEGFAVRTVDRRVPPVPVL